MKNQKSQFYFENDLAEKKQIIQEAKNNTLSQENEKKFIDYIMENYFLDNDNINFLNERGFHFFDFSENDDCFCLSNLKFNQCCFSKLSSQKDENYIPFLKAILNDQDYQKYLKFFEKIFQEQLNIVKENQTCLYPDCCQKVIKNNLYNINFEKEKYYSTSRVNPVDNFFKMGTNFFSKITKNQFIYYGFCQNHYFEIKQIELNDFSLDNDIIKVHFANLVYKLFTVNLKMNILKYEFINYFNSIDNETVKKLFIYNLKKVSNHLKSLKNFYSYFCRLLKNEVNTYQILKYSFNKTENFQIFDLIQPQICPNDFKLVNSINNIFVEEKFGSICLNTSKKQSYVTILFQKDQDNLKAFFSQYEKKINDKVKYQQTFISNCSLILADNIVFSKKWFDKLSEQEKKLYSALNKFRFEHPKMGQEYLKMRFFAGFEKGINFF